MRGLRAAAGAVGGVALASLVGCLAPSFATLKSARAIDPGTSQATLEGDLGAIDAPRGNAEFPPTSAAPHALSERTGYSFGARSGLVDGFDLGLKSTLLISFPTSFSTGGIGVADEFNGTVSLVRSLVFDLALAPAVGGVIQLTGANLGDALYAKLPLLFGVRFGDRRQHELVLGPEAALAGIVSGDPYTASGAAPAVLLAGGLIGVAIDLGSQIQLMPELTVLAPIFTPAVAPGQSFSPYGTPGTVLFEAGLGFNFGNDGLRTLRPGVHAVEVSAVRNETGEAALLGLTDELRDRLAVAGYGGSSRERAILDTTLTAESFRVDEVGNSVVRLTVDASLVRDGCDLLWRDRGITIDLTMVPSDPLASLGSRRVEALHRAVRELAARVIDQLAADR